jgi:hypothetical protein
MIAAPQRLGFGVALASMLFSTAAVAQGTLEGRLVTFTVLTYDDPAQPFLQARGKTVMVGQGVEFGLGPEGFTGGLDVVPVTVEIGPSRIELSYPLGSGQFYTSTFNGYVLRFETECALFQSVAIDPEATTMALGSDNIRAETGALFINVSGRDYGPDQRIALDIVVADCPIS